MQTYRIPHTDLQASRLAYGCMNIGGRWGATSMSKDERKAAIDAVVAAFDHGINFFDHADIYMQGRSEEVFAEASRILRPDRVIALYVCDSFVKGEGFYPIGFELFSRLRQLFVPLDIVAVVRHNRTLEQGNYRKAAEEGNFFLRGFNYLFVARKPLKKSSSR